MGVRVEGVDSEGEGVSRYWILYILDAKEAIWWHLLH